MRGKRAGPCYVLISVRFDRAGCLLTGGPKWSQSRDDAQYRQMDWSTGHPVCRPHQCYLCCPSVCAFACLCGCYLSVLFGQQSRGSRLAAATF